MGGGTRRGAAVSRLVAVILLAGTGCGGEAPEGAGEATGEARVEAPAARAEPARYLGILTVEGGSEITLCDGGLYPLDGPASLALLELHASLAPGLEPMEGIFVDVLGELREDGHEPWVYALEVMRAAWEGWGCGTRDEGVLYRAAGTEPFWSLTVGDSTATWRTPEGMEQFVHGGPYAMTRGGWVVEGEVAGGGGALRAEFMDEPCRDAMSGAYSHLTAGVSREGREFRGCAYRAPGTVPVG